MPFEKVASSTDGEASLRCPSAQPGMADAEVLGLVETTPEGPRVAYVNGHVPASEELLRSAAPLEPTEIFRLSARCEEKKCTHFDGSRCQLAVRIVDMMPAVGDYLPPCSIRRTCRWYAQEGRAACLRCPQVVTHNKTAGNLLVRVAGAGQGAESPAPPSG